MNNLSLSTMNNNNTTTVSNVFIDEFMPLANGEFTKIYLYLLRCISNGKTNISIDCLADFFNQTEADIMCALRYWDKAVQHAFARCDFICCAYNQHCHYKKQYTV